MISSNAFLGNWKTIEKARMNDILMLFGGNWKMSENVRTNDIPLIFGKFLG